MYCVGLTVANLLDDPILTAATGFDGRVLYGVYFSFTALSFLLWLFFFSRQPTTKLEQGFCVTALIFTVISFIIHAVTLALFAAWGGALDVTFL